jgi:leader peptidase (prepilin peptidase)/N-methyltransferase
MDPAFAPWLLGLFGLAAGSFLNVVIYRVPARQSIVWPGSYCPACKAPIRWYDNTPVLGWLLLGGRCRRCRKPIGIRYPIVEAVTGGIFVVHHAVFGWDPILVPRLLLACALIALFAIDLEHKLLPNAITLPGIAAGLVFSLVFPPGFVEAALGASLGYASLWVVATVGQRIWKREAMGGGDLKMLAMIGAFLGWRLTALTWVLSFFLGGAGSGLLLVAGRAKRASETPFGTYIALAALVASLWGERLLNWYLSLYR